MTASLVLLGSVQGVAQARKGATMPAVRASLRAELSGYLSSQRVPAHLSALGLAVTFRGQRSGINLAVGRTRYLGGRPISPYALWQIGSNTKAFTSVMLLQLEAEHKLSINDRLGKWLPQYPAWRRISIKRLLNMTAGIPDYLEQPDFFRAYAAVPDQVFSAPWLVSYAVGLPLTTGWAYSNTQYVLAQMIIERVTHDSYGDQLRRRIAGPLGLRNLFYSATRYPRKVLERLPAGYFYDHSVPGMAPLLGTDQGHRSLSYAQGAGGIVISLQDMARWDRALYTGRELPPKQQHELESLVSKATGKPISRTTPTDASGFGLGIEQDTDQKLGVKVWNYSGETFGFVVVHIYLPRSGTIITLGLNSATDANPTAAQFLLASIYKTLHRARLA